MIQAESVHSTPRTDSSLSRRLSERELTPREGTKMAKVEQDERSWRAGYAAAYPAKLAGKPTLRAPHRVDGVSYASGAVEGAAAGELELTPKDVLIDLFVEELHPDPEWMAERVVERLKDAGFVIWPYEPPKPPKAP